MERNKTSGLFNSVARMASLLYNLPPWLLSIVGELMMRIPLPDSLMFSRAFMTPRNRDASISFLKMIGKWILNARRARKRGKKVFLVPFNFPPELIHAFENAVPLTSEVLTTLAVVTLPGKGEEYWEMAMGLGLPDHICSANAIEVGSMLGTEDFKPDAVIQSALGACDVNTKIHEFLARYFNIPQFFLPKIPDDTEKGKDQYLLSMYSLIHDIEDFTGEKLTEEKLRKVIEKANRCTELYYELWDLHKAVPCPVPNIFSLFTYGVRFTMWGTDDGIRVLETMVNVAKKRLREKAYPYEREIARTLWCYTSYYFDVLNIFNWMEEQGYTHLGDGLDLCFPEIIDTSDMDSMLAGICRAALNMPMTRQVGGESMWRCWTEDVIYAAKELGADCVIFCGHHACKQTWSVVSILRKELEKRTGLPLLVLQGDSWIGRITPVSVIQREIDEFVRNVVLKRKGGKRKVRRYKKGLTSPEDEVKDD